MKIISKLISWKKYSFYLKEKGCLNNKLLIISIDNFWNNSISKLIDSHVTILVRIKGVNGSIVTIGKLIKLNTTNLDKRLLLDYVKNNLVASL